VCSPYPGAWKFTWPGSLSNLKGVPSYHVVPIRDVRLSAGAEFVVAICGQIMTLPGLPKVPAANNIGLDKNGLVEGLF